MSLSSLKCVDWSVENIQSPFRLLFVVQLRMNKPVFESNSSYDVVFEEFRTILHSRITSLSAKLYLRFSLEIIVWRELIFFSMSGLDVNDPQYF